MKLVAAIGQEHRVVAPDQVPPRPKGGGAKDIDSDKVRAGADPSSAPTNKL
jgi:hypothetical protein